MNQSLTTNELFIIAAVQRLGSEGYGVSIRERIVATADTDLMLGTIYAALERLERRKLVKSRWGSATAKRGGRRKRLYEITAHGSVVLNFNVVGPKKILSELPGTVVAT